MIKAEQAALELRVLRLQREGAQCTLQVSRCTRLPTCRWGGATKLVHFTKYGVCADYTLGDPEEPSAYVDESYAGWLEERNVQS